MTKQASLGASISTKLLAGIAALILLAVFAALVALGTLDSTREAQQKLTGDTFPVLRLAQELSYEVVSYLQAIEQRYAIDGSTVPLSQTQKLEEREQRINGALEELRLRILGRDNLVQVEDSLKKIFVKKDYLESVSSDDRPSLLATLYFARQISGDALEGLRRELERYRITSQAVLPETRNTLANLQELVAELGYIVAVAADINDTHGNLPLQSEFKVALRKLVRYSELIEDSKLREYIAGKADLLLTQVSNPEGLFPTLQSKHLLDDQIAQAIHYTKVRGFELERYLDALVVRASDQASADIRQFDRQTGSSLDYLFYTVFALFIGSLLLIFAYLIPRVTRRLEKLSESTQALSEGDFEVEFNTSGGDELGRMAQALDRFRISLAEKQKTTDLLKAMLEASDNGILITDDEGKNTLSNQLFQDLWNMSEQLFHSSDQEQIVEHISNQLRKPQEFLDSRKRNINSGNVGTRETLELKDGRFIERYTQPFQSSGKTFRIFSFRDVTEQLETQNSLHVAKEHAEQAARAKSEFLAMMSHEIRTPMNGVLGMLNLLLDTPMDDEQKHRTGLAISSAESLLGLINDILDFSKVEAGKLEFESVDFDLQEMLGEIAEGMALRAEEKGIDLILDVRGVRPAMVNGDPGRVRQVFSNLISNAIKFTDQGEVLIHAHLSEGMHKPIQLVAWVRDTGIGIPKDKLASLFDEFSQVDASTTRKYGGTGLGLAIARKLCERMGGSVEAESQEGRGSHFSFTIELDRATQDLAYIDRANLEYKSVLLVEPNPSMQEILSLQLSDWGLKVSEVVNAKAAVATCKQRRELGYEPVFDMALIDMDLPDKDGRELGVELSAKEGFPGIQKVLMTPMSMSGESRELAREGFVSSFPKPVTIKDLNHALSVAFSKKVASLHSIQSEPEASREQAGQEHQAPELPTGIRILLVEDNQINQLVAKGLLEQIGLHADVAGDGHEALEVLKMAPDDAPYVLVLMDCQMPVMDGYEATQQIRQGEAGARYCDLAIVAMTANAMQGDKDKCIAVGMDDYLSKPVNLDALRDVIERLHADNRLSA